MKKVMKFVAVFLFALVSAALAAEEQLKPVKYVFLFIGDGMSVPQRSLAQYYQIMTGGPKLFINNMPFGALTTTRSSSSYITDSAASGTAIACGEKTKNGAVGRNADNTADLESIASVAKKSGRKVGIVTSVTLNHATPAAFYAHQGSRSYYYEIGLQLIDSGFDYFGGGGLQGRNNEKSKIYQGDLYEVARKKGMKVVEAGKSGPESLKALKAADGRILVTGAEQDLPYQLDAEEQSKLTLKDFVAKGIEILDNPRGFFMMAEGGKIDWSCHANDAATVLREVQGFNAAVQVAADFAAKHPDETLIVVTGDHETGGLTMGFQNTGYNSYINLLQNQKCSLNEFNGIMKRWFAGNPDGRFDQVKPVVTKWFNLKFAGDEKDRLVLTQSEQDDLKAAFERNLKEPKKNAFAMSVVKTMDHKAGLGWTSGAHTALPVFTSAYGAGAHVFSGYIDNTDIARFLKQTVR